MGDERDTTKVGKSDARGKKVGDGKGKKGGYVFCEGWRKNVEEFAGMMIQAKVRRRSVEDRQK